MQFSKHALLMLAAVLSSCGQKTVSSIICPLQIPHVTYSQLKTSFFPNCTPCHNQTLTDRNGAPKDVNYDSYGAAKDSAIIGEETVFGLLMPPGAAQNGNILPASTACLLQAWVFSGMPP